MSMLSNRWRSHSTQIDSAQQANASERKSDFIPEEPVATSLLFEELIAQKPHRWPSHLPAGHRGPDGERMGRGRARSLSFDGVSPYQAGDDPRWVDWRATARSGKLQVKRFAAQSHRARMVVLCLDARLFFGTKHQLMSKTAALLAARLVFDAQLINEPVGLVCYGEDPIPAKRGRRHLWLLLECIHQSFVRCSNHLENNQESNGSGNVALALETAQSMLRSGDEICLVDELVAYDAEFEDWSKGAAARNHLACYIVRDDITRSEISAGRYPARQKTNGHSSSLSIASRNVGQANAVLAKHQKQGVNHLRSLGWQVCFADEILSQSNTGRAQ